jgi:hypothetical protein
MKKIVVLLVVLLGCMPVTAFAQKQFFFKDGRFVVAQFTDLHWMPGSAKCAETAATIRAGSRTSGHCYTEWGCGDR